MKKIFIIFAVVVACWIIAFYTWGEDLFRIKDYKSVYSITVNKFNENHELVDSWELTQKKRDELIGFIQNHCYIGYIGDILFYQRENNDQYIVYIDGYKYDEEYYVSITTCGNKWINVTTDDNSRYYKTGAKWYEELLQILENN